MLSDEFDYLYEMSGFKSTTTGLPSNLEIWTRAEQSEHGHSRYRVEVKKDNKWAGIFLVGSNAALIKNINRSLLPGEVKLIQQFIQEHKSALINLIDNKIDATECGMAIMKQRGAL